MRSFAFRFYAISLLMGSTVSVVCGEETLPPQELAIVEKLPAVPANLNRGYFMQAKPATRVKAVLTAGVNASSFSAQRWVYFMPVAPDTDGQTVIGLSTDPTSREGNDLSPRRRPLRISEIAGAPNRTHAADFKYELDVQLNRRELLNNRRVRRGAVTPLEPRERLLNLRPSTEVDYASPAFAKWKAERQLIRRKREGEIEFGLRAFRALVAAYRYRYIPAQDRSASALCGVSETDCGGLSTLFVAALRSEGIPARVLIGRWAKSARQDETLDGNRYMQYHVIAVFYAQGVGWVPVDPSSAVLHDRTPTKLRYFGKDVGNFIAFHLDSGVVYDTILHGETRMAYFQTPLFWVRGQGDLSDRKLRDDWKVSSLSNDPVNASPRKHVFLRIAHLQQAKDLCVPTCASMALRYYGQRIDPLTIKQLAHSVTSQPEFPGTMFKDLVNGLAKKNVHWNERYFQSTDEGFEKGLAAITESLRDGKPVLVDTYVPPHGHTVLVNGYDPNRKLISIVDPNARAPGTRTLSYEVFKTSWRSLTADVRGAIFTNRPGE